MPGCMHVCGYEAKAEQVGLQHMCKHHSVCCGTTCKQLKQECVRAADTTGEGGGGTGGATPHVAWMLSQDSVDKSEELEAERAV